MAINNFKSSNTVNAAITNIVKDSGELSFTFTVKVETDDISKTIYKNAVLNEKAFIPGRILNLKEISFLSNNNAVNLDSFEKTGKIKSVDFSSFNTLNYFDFTIKINASGQAIYNNLTNLSISSFYNKFVFMKIGAKKYQGTSGKISKGFKKILDDLSFEQGTLPSNRITTGKLLNSNLEKPFSDINLVKFAQTSDTTGGIGLKLSGLSTGTSKFNQYYIGENITNINDALYSDQYSMSNSLLVNTPNDLGILQDTIKVSKTVTSKDVNNNIKQKRFKEEITSFNDSISLPFNDSKEFYTKTIDKENKLNYDIKNQKKIKIDIDFTNSIDLHLLNTKFSFNFPQESDNKNDFAENSNKDNIINTRFFNFINNTSYSISSHFMPTAYWDFSNSKWSYLEGIKPAAAQYNGILGHRSNFTLGLFSGGANKEYSDILPDFIFDNQLLKTSTIIDNHTSLKTAMHFSKPLMTTPGFRNDGSFNLNNDSEDFNKSPICQITDSYGFPYKTCWQPHDNHTLRMSDYIARDFLLEKIVIKGKYSSKGEMPTKKGNFYSGFLKENQQDAVDSLEKFNSNYEMKDSHKGYISNSLTFFLLNERKGGLNYFNSKLKVNPLQHYNFIQSNETQNEIDTRQVANALYFNSEGSHLNTFEGTFNTYEEYNNTLRVSSYITPNRFLYRLNDFNSLSIEGNLVQDNTSSDIGSFNKSNFYCLTENVGQAINANEKEVIYIKNNENWTSDNININLIDDSYKSYIIESDVSEDLKTDSTRDLVTYANMLITAKNSSITFDSSILKNIDAHINNDIVGNDLHLNVPDSSPENFVIESFCKGQEKSSYSDESEYKIKSNYIVNTIIPQKGSSFELEMDFQDNTINQSNLFEFPAGSENGQNGKGIDTLLGFSTNGGGIPYIESQPYFTNLVHYNYNYSDQASVTRKSVANKIFFSYENPLIGNTVGMSNNEVTEDQNYGGGSGRLDNDIKINLVRLSDFIRVEQVQENNEHFNKIIINARIFQLYENYSILYDFISKINILKRNNTYSINLDNTYFNNIITNSSSVDLKITNRSWSDETYETKQLFMSTIIIMSSFYLKALGVDTSNMVYIDGTTIDNYNMPELNFELEIQESDQSKAVLALNHFNKKFMPYPLNGGVISFIGNENYNNSSHTIKTSLVPGSNIKGDDETIQKEEYHNLSYNLEGKYSGETNGLGIKSDRIINKEPLNYQLSNKFKTKSGKLIDNRGENSIVRTNYLLKPEDNLVLGVTSNCNGQTMPTALRLHDKLEITLIGRDYVDEKQYRNNESKSIRKTVVGDDYIEKSKNTIYQTKSSYYDNVWNINKIKNSESDFENKSKIGENSSRLFGTYSGVLTTASEFTYAESGKQREKYISDTVNPSLGKVFTDTSILNKNSLDLVDFADLKEIDNSDNLNNSATHISVINSVKSSNKVIITENNYLHNIQDLNFSQNMITNWHKTYHLKEYESFFKDENNIAIDDISSTYLKDQEKNAFIYYDINSFSMDLSFLEKYFLIHHNEDFINSDISNDVNAGIYDVFNRYLSFKSYCLPNSSLKKYQNGLQIQNLNNFKSRDENNDIQPNMFINSDVEIQKSQNINKVSIGNISLQYFNSNMNVKEYCNDLRSYNFTINDFSPQWHLVIDLNDEEFKFLIESLDQESKDNYLLDSLIDIFLYESNESNELCVSKTGKITKYEDNLKQISIPLYYWETLEIDNTFFNNNSNIIYGRYEDRENSVIQLLGSDHDNNPNTEGLWYARLNNNNKVSSNAIYYKPFINETIWTNNVQALNGKPYVGLKHNEIVSNLPYSFENLSSYISSNNDSGVLKELLVSKPFYVSVCKFQNKNIENFTVNEIKNNNFELLDNNYKLNLNSRVWTHKKYLENNLSKINKRKLSIKGNLDESDFYLNEKVYRSKIYKKEINNFKETSCYLVYKVHIMTSTLPSSNSDNNKYYIVEPLAFDANGVYSTDYIDINSNLIGFDQSDILRIYEDKLLENFNHNELTGENKTPYFEIKLGSRSSTFGDGEFEDTGMLQLPYLYNNIKDNLKFDIESNIGVKSISELYSNDFLKKQNKNLNDTRRVGTPLFKLDSNPRNFIDIESQENKIKNFFYGFSRGKNRYPVERLDGFKYGVENGSKKTVKFHFSVSRFGQFADMVNGSTNTTTVSSGSRITRPIEKKFVNKSFQFLNIDDSSNADVQGLTTYNKDLYARSSYPFIENKEDPLSQIYNT